MQFFNNSIRSGVMKVLNKRIADAQKEHDDFCRGADEQCKREKAEAEAKARVVKADSERAQISRVLGNLI